jgi:hypothetical protein
MPNIFHQSVEDILKAATPEQKLMWNEIFLRFGERVAISQFSYVGSVAGSEMTVYAANKYYIAYQLGFSCSAVQQVVAGNTLLYDAANAIHYYLRENTQYWDATAAAARFMMNEQKINNVHFSRFSNTYYNFVLFHGYRLGI